jgi:hypothetical protein
MTTGTGLGYGVAGGYGSLALPFQAFITAFRPVGIGISGVGGYYSLGSGLPALGGYGTGGIEYGSLEMLAGLVTDDVIYQAIADTAPEATIMWSRITDKVAPIATFVTSSAKLIKTQDDQKVSATAFLGAYVATLNKTQADQTLSASGSTGFIRGTLAVTQASQILVASAGAPTTWNQADATNISLSSGNLIASTTSATAGGVRSSTPNSGAKRYVEIKATSAKSGERIGFANALWSETTALGSDSNSLGIEPNGNVWFKGAIIGTTTPWTAGSTLCLADDDTTQTIWARVNGGVWDDRVGTVSGSQAIGTTGPIVHGPASAQVTATSNLTVPGLTVTDTIWPRSGNVTLLATANAGTLTMIVGGTAVHGSGTSNIAYSSTSDNVVAALSTLVYTAGSIAGADVLTITVQDQVGAANTMTVPITVSPQADPATGVGGFPYAGIGAGPLFVAYSAAVSAASVTADFGATTFGFSVPQGYLAWAGNAASGPPSGAFVVTASAETASSITLTWTPLS